MKSWPSEYCLEANKHQSRFGGYGYKSFPLERFYRDNRLTPFMKAHGIQALDLIDEKFLPIRKIFIYLPLIKTMSKQRIQNKIW